MATATTSSTARPCWVPLVDDSPCDEVDESADVSSATASSSGSTDVLGLPIVPGDKRRRRVGAVGCWLIAAIGGAAAAVRVVNFGLAVRHDQGILGIVVRGRAGGVGGRAAGAARSPRPRPACPRADRAGGK